MRKKTGNKDQETRDVQLLSKEVTLTIGVCV